MLSFVRQDWRKWRTVTQHSPRREESASGPKAPRDRRPDQDPDNTTAAAPARQPHPDRLGHHDPEKDMGGTSAAQEPATGGTDSDCQPRGHGHSSALGQAPARDSNRDAASPRLGPPDTPATAPAVPATAAGGQATSNQRGSGTRASYRTTRQGRPAPDDIQETNLTWRHGPWRHRANGSPMPVTNNSPKAAPTERPPGIKLD